MVATLPQQNNMKGLLSGWGLSARPCDTCHTAAALLYCRADAAFLCGGCDTKIHTANRHGTTMTIRHERVWMCEVCEQAPAAVTCKADAAALCTSCDHDIHAANPLANRHERIPVIPFLDSAVNAAVRSSAATSTLLVPDNLPAAVPPPIPAPTKFDHDDAEAWLIPNPTSTFLYNDATLLDFSHNCQTLEKLPQQNHQQQSLDNCFAFTDSVVPTQSTGNLSFSNAANRSYDNCFDIDFSQPSKNHKNNNKDNIQQLFSAFNYSAQHSVSSSDIGVVPEAGNISMSEVSYTYNTAATNSSGDSPTATGAPAPGLDREARVLRYREKRKNRKFEKTIRYASRKAYAETRPRIKGRFAKRSENSKTSEVEAVFGFGSGSGSGSKNGFIIDHGYGVVPTF